MLMMKYQGLRSAETLLEKVMVFVGHGRAWLNTYFVYDRDDLALINYFPLIS